MKWETVSMADIGRWRSVVNELLRNHQLVLGDACPLCRVGTLRIAFALDGEELPTVVGGHTLLGRGRRWEWCENCFTCAYYPDSAVPDWAGSDLVDEKLGLRDPSEVIRLLSSPGQ